MSVLPCVEIEPTEPSELGGSIVWLHGLGADGHDFEPIVPYLRLPRIRFVFPHAPRRPVTINAGMIMPAWYDVRFAGPGGSDLDQIEESREQIETLIDREVERFTSERVVLAGFSQGGAMALHTGLRYDHSLLGIIVLSAYQVRPETHDRELRAANENTPILFCHGSSDPLVPISLGRQAYKSLSRSGRAVEWHDYPIGHEVSMSEIEEIGTWLRRMFD